MAAARETVGVRLRRPAIGKLDQMADEHDSKRSVVVRTILSVAMQDPKVMRAVAERLKEND